MARRSALEVAQMGALLVEDVECDLRAGSDVEVMRGALDQRLLERAQDLQRHRRRRADGRRCRGSAGRPGRGLDHAGAEALARHLQQAERRDAADLDAGAVGLEPVLELLLDGAVVAPVLHVDEVDDDEAGEVAQPHLAGDLLGGLDIGLERGVLDRGLAGRAARVHVDRDQRLGHVDDDVAAGLELSPG